MKKLTLLTMALVIIMSGLINSAPKKRVLLEQHTGAWCGWCPDGTFVMDQILQQYPDQVIGVKVHNGDQMVIPEEPTLRAGLAYPTFPGWPTGIIDRRINLVGNGSTFLNRGYWKAACEAAMQEVPKVEVELFWTYSSSNRQLSATISCKILESMTKDLRFNVFICEDNVSGTGNGWDQSNYLSGRAGFENNPFYTQPSVIVGYKHMKTVRKMLGGAWGTEGIIPSGAAVGSTYNHTYNVTLDQSWKIDDIFVVGLVQEYSSQYVDGRTVLNSVVGMQGTPTSELTSTGPSLAVKPTGTAFSKTFNLRNVTNEQITFRVNDEVSERTPSDWTWQVTASNGIVTKSEKTQATEITLNAGLATDITIELTPGATVGIGDLSIEVFNKYDPTGQRSVGTITVLSAEIENLQINDYSEAQYTLMPHMQSAGLTSSLELSTSEFEQVAPFLNNLNILVWNCGEKGNLTASEANQINTAINEGVNVFMLGTILANSTDNSVKSMLSYAGVQFLKQCYQGQGTAQGKINIMGYQGDPISNGFDQPGTLLYYYSPALKAIGPNAHPFLRHKSVDTVVAVHSMVDETRIIVLGINPFVITSDYERNNLIKKCFEWLQGSGPSISCAEDMSFTSTEAGQTSQQTLTLENKGKSALNITDIEVEYDYSANFKIIGDKTFSVPAGGTYDLVLEFKPSYAIQYDSWIRIYSNAENDPIKQVNVSGLGTKASAGPVVSLSISEVSFVDVSVGGNETRKFTVNNTGNQDLEVTNITVPGAYTPLFTIEPTSFTVAVGAGQEVNVTFVPLDVLSIETNLTISSNNKEGAVLLPLSANSIVGVEDGTSQSALLKLFAGPNPFSENAKIEFTLNGDMSQQVEIVLIDATGRTVKAIDSKLFEPGTYNYDLNSSDMTSGTYYIITKTNDYKSQLQIVVVK